MSIRFQPMHPQPPNRRRFFGRTASALLSCGLLPAFSQGQTSKARLKFAVIGINHEHVFRMVEAVRQGGGELAMIFAPDMDPNHGAKFLRENSSVKVARTEAEVLESKDISLIITAAKPADRAAVGARAMRAGKDVLADKGGILSLAHLDGLRRIQAETKRIFSISYNERLLLPVSIKIDNLLQAGAIGKVTHMKGLGPHGLYGHGPREDWFWTRAGRGGILMDIGTHQADQFLHYVGGEGAQVVTSGTGNFDNPGHPEFEDHGTVTWRSSAGAGQAMVSFHTGKSGGFVLELTGTEGHMLVRKHAGQIIITAKNGARKEYKVDPQTSCPFGHRLVDDILNRTETAMTQKHTFLTTELAVRAQLAAVKLARKPEGA
ncbi:MAG TPA: Gfo/Idh/MocA family oxidoreductase [Prosthecobacter sp.]